MASASVPFVKIVREGTIPVLSETIRRPGDAAQILATHLAGADREHFIVLLLDSQNRVLAVNTVSIGSLDEAVVHPRETYKPAILMSAAAIIVGHNHPSGDVRPSMEDCAVTARLAEAGKILGIELLDSLVVAEGGAFHSLKENGGW
jgi:DNA repair protein RadC